MGVAGQVHKERDPVVLVEDLPEYGLLAGDVGTVVLIHRRAEAFQVEFATLGGETVAVVTLEAGQVRPVGSREIAHARAVEG